METGFIWLGENGNRPVWFFNVQEPLKPQNFNDFSKVFPSEWI